MKGLFVSVYGCSIMPPRFNGAILRVPGVEIFDSRDDRPAIELIEADPKWSQKGYLLVRRSDGVVRQVYAQLVGETRWVSFSGSFIFTGDSRFPYSSPIPLFMVN